MAKLRRVAAACILYAQDHGGSYPQKMADLYPEYIWSVEAFACPSAVFQELLTGRNRIATGRAVYLLVPDLKPDAPSDRILAYDASALNHGGLGRNVAYVNGHVAWVPGSDAEFAALLGGRSGHRPRPGHPGHAKAG